MTDRDVTTVEVKTDTWTALNKRREPGDSMDDIISRALSDPADEARRRRDPDTPRQDVEAAVAELDWSVTDPSHSPAREAAIADAVEVLAYAGVCSRRTVKRVVVESDRDLGLTESSRERLAADLVQRVPGVRAEASDLFWGRE